MCVVSWVQKSPATLVANPGHPGQKPATTNRKGNMGTQVKVMYIPPCDICAVRRNKPSLAYADANIPGMGWANVCKMHFVNLGCKLGTGLGQELIQEEPELQTESTE